VLLLLLCSLLSRPSAPPSLGTFAGAAASSSAAVAVAPTAIGPGHFLAPTGTPPATATSPLYRSSVAARRKMAQSSLPQPPLGTAYTTYTPASAYYAASASRKTVELDRTAGAQRLLLHVLLAILSTCPLRFYQVYLLDDDD